MYDNSIYRYLKKLAIFALPMVFVAVVYVVSDPFKVVWTYERYFEDNMAHVGLNMDFVSTENFASRNPSQRYNAFIFGNSRSQYWRVDDWKKHLGTHARCYHFYGNGESLYAMQENIRYIDGCENNIDDALLVIDTELLSQTEPKTGHLFCTPPRVTGFQNILTFHVTNFTAFLHPLFIYTYLDLQLTEQLKPYMLERYYVEQPVVYHPVNNEIIDEMYDKAIADNTYYTRKRMLRFRNKQHPDSISPIVLHDKNKQMLEKIARIFQKHHTRYRIVISPLYNQIKFNPTDFHVLETIFGKSNVYDFSGKNAITSDYHNYYEDSHYRPNIAAQLMDSVYFLEDSHGLDSLTHRK